MKNDIKKAKRSKNLTWILFIASLVINLRLFLINNFSFLIFGGVVSSFAAIAIVLHDNDLTKIKSNLLSLEQIKKELNVKIPMLEKELKNLKEQVSYKKFNAEIVENRGLDSLQLSEPKTSYKKEF